MVVATYLAAAGTVMDAYLEGEVRGEASAQLKAVGKLLRDALAHADGGQIVTGPSFTSATFISAAKTPV